MFVEQWPLLNHCWFKKMCDTYWLNSGNSKSCIICGGILLLPGRCVQPGAFLLPLDGSRNEMLHCSLTKRSSSQGTASINWAGSQNGMWWYSVETRCETCWTDVSADAAGCFGAECSQCVTLLHEEAVEWMCGWGEMPELHSVRVQHSHKNDWSTIDGQLEGVRNREAQHPAPSRVTTEWRGSCAEAHRSSLCQLNMKRCDGFVTVLNSL